MADAEAVEDIRTAGAVIWRPAASAARAAAAPAAAPQGSSADQVQVALIHRPKYDDWSFAKGKLEPCEPVLLGCVREVFEETGLTVTLGRRLHHVRYAYQDRGHGPDAPGHKRVDYWAATADDASLPFTANREVDRLEWQSVAEARMRLSYAHDVALLDEFAAGPIRTAPLIWLRHASAGSRLDWPDDDITRPLDAMGLKAAEELAGLLRCFGTARVLSSPAERCLATVRPYAEAVGVPVETEAALAVGAEGSARGQHETASLAADLAAAGEPVVVCAHRENMPVLIKAACEQLGSEPPDGAPLRKGEFLVLHTAAGKVAAAERHFADEAPLECLATAADPRR